MAMGGGSERFPGMPGGFAGGLGPGKGMRAAGLGAAGTGGAVGGGGVGALLRLMRCGAAGAGIVPGAAWAGAEVSPPREGKRELGG